jgi:hypothetical protein
MAQQPPVCQGLLIIEASRSHSDTPHSVGLLWTSDQPVTESSTWQNTTLVRDRQPCPGEIRTHNPSKRTAADPLPRPRGHWDRRLRYLYLNGDRTDRKEGRRSTAVSVLNDSVMKTYGRMEYSSTSYQLTWCRWMISCKIASLILKIGIGLLWMVMCIPLPLYPVSVESIWCQHFRLRVHLYFKECRGSGSG